ncbi:MAG: hypothetical protein VYC85_01160 [Pseudomonadota bacterium]|nr:hypothetical protein [Pseudomonadota bacterium]
MKVYIVLWRDQAGHHRQFASSKRAAEKIKSEIKKGAEFGEVEINCEKIRTDKKGLISWLNLNAGNADGNLL